MPVYYLEPKDGDTSNESWRASSLREGCWTEANTEHLARRQVEQSTFEAIESEDGDSFVPSPWPQRSLVLCRIEEGPQNVPSNKILSRSGKIIDVPAISESS
jgi:hypothetical protein